MAYKYWTVSAEQKKELFDEIDNNFTSNGLQKFINFLENINNSTNIISIKDYLQMNSYHLGEYITCSRIEKLYEQNELINPLKQILASNLATELEKHNQEKSTILMNIEENFNAQELQGFMDFIDQTNLKFPITNDEFKEEKIIQIMEYLKNTPYPLKSFGDAYNIGCINESKELLNPLKEILKNKLVLESKQTIAARKESAQDHIKNRQNQYAKILDVNKTKDIVK